MILTCHRALQHGYGHRLPYVTTYCRRFGRPAWLGRLRQFSTETSDQSEITATKEPKEDAVKPAGKFPTSELTLPRDGTPLRCTKDQWLYLPTAQEVEMFTKSAPLPTRPMDAEGSVIVRLVDLKEGVTSPVGRSIHYSEYGIRKGELLRVILLGAVSCSTFCYLGYWQLQRRDWKVNLLNQRKDALSQPLAKIDSFQNLSKKIVSEDNPDPEYRSVECSGVLDTSCRILVGPRPSLYHTYGDNSGYNVVYPLRFRDGSCVLVNMGWLGSDEVMADTSCPEWVTLRGIVVKGEIRESFGASLKAKIVEKYNYMMSTVFGTPSRPSTTYINRPTPLSHNGSVKVYTYVDPMSLSQEIYTKSPEMTGTYALNAYDVLYHDDREESIATDKPHFTPKSNVAKSLYSVRPNYQRRQKSDYLLFYAEPETHLNYAAQWFLMAGSIGAMCVYKMFRVSRVLKTPL